MKLKYYICKNCGTIRASKAILTTCQCSGSYLYIGEKYQEPVITGNVYTDHEKGINVIQ